VFVVLAHAEGYPTRVLGVFAVTSDAAFTAGERWNAVHPEGWWSLISTTIEGMKG